MDSSFILTMWYVNLLFIKNWSLSPKRFILTMWCVNEKEIVPGMASTKQSFILTMWYVNMNLSKVLNSCNCLFYINYVICKFNNSN